VVVDRSQSVCSLFISSHLLAYGLWWVKPVDMPETIVQRTSDQNRQAQLLVAEIQKHEGLVIIACDCNSKETAGSHRILASAMTNAARESGRRIGAKPLANAKQDTDLQHIDYIFYRGDLMPLNVYALQDSGGSDHLPVLALFGF
jgi:endonuclease/exonuclease/phosphatase (EEP) superfamily protein YafD